MDEFVERYVYDVDHIVKVTDGDTYDLVTWQDIGFGDVVYRRKSIRLDYADTPEKTKGSSFERAEAKHAETVAREWLIGTSRKLKMRTRKPGVDRPPIGDGGFGRWLGDIWDDNTGEHLAHHLQALGLASVWPARWRDVYDHSGMVD